MPVLALAIRHNGLTPKSRKVFPSSHVFFFLGKQWKLVANIGDDDWIKKEVARELGSPSGAIGPALQRILAHGASEDDLTTIVSVMQWELLFGFCYLHDDPGLLELEVKDIAWRLFQVDRHDQPIAVIGDLHESVLETDPMGKEMR